MIAATGRKTRDIEQVLRSEGKASKRPVPRAIDGDPLAWNESVDCIGHVMNLRFIISAAKGSSAKSH
ncbi:MAG: hypothetical protein WB902_03540 [Acetobacteraceae bacterium]|jgi:hypothetical protein